MINIPNKITPPLNRRNLEALNNKNGIPIDRNTISTLNMPKLDNSAVRSQSISHAEIKQSSPQAQNVQQSNQSKSIPLQDNAVANNQQQIQQKLPDIKLPVLQNPLRKGQKTALSPKGHMYSTIKACFGWNIKDSRCDMDASVFLIGDKEQVPGDEWFVFYGQTTSPDNSVSFGVDSMNIDREIISIDFRRLNPAITKMVFVLTINEAFENYLNFSMIKDAYVRLIDASTNKEIVSYKIEEYYPNVTSMTIGEIYLHNGQWKFNPVGNGVHQDLAGQCRIYGVEIA